MQVVMESKKPFWHRFQGEYRTIMLPSYDGTELFTQVLSQTPDSKGPVVVIRSPYELVDAPPPEFFEGYLADLVDDGYVIVYQHCRGCGKSDGECVPYLNERQDGLALLEWIRKQPFYAEEIFLTGGSYLSSVHLSYLNAAGDDIKGAVLAVQDCNRYNILYRNGFFKCGLHGSWAVGMYKKKQLTKKNFTKDSFRMFPLSALAETVFGEANPLLTEEFCHPDPADPFWETPEGGKEYKHALENLKFPVLFTTSFYDIYTEGVIDMWEKLSPESREKCALVVTPYSHAYLGNANVVIPYKNGALEDMWPHFQNDWFNSIREKRPPRFVTPGCVTWHAQHEALWRTAPHLENGPKAKTFFLNARTLEAENSEEERIDFTYNPYNPAEFKGGCCNNFEGQQLQDAPDSRYDIISFLSKVLEKDMVLQGRGEVVLKVASDCEDTCFYARLSYINSAGECYCLRDDIVSLRGQHPDYTPGTAVEIKLNFAPNAVRIAQGEQLRLDISSSCWPYFLPHRNRVGNYWEMESAAIARNTIFTGSSKLTLFER